MYVEQQSQDFTCNQHGFSFALAASSFNAGGKKERLSVIISLLRAKFNVVHDSPKWKYVTSHGDLSSTIKTL